MLGYRHRVGAPETPAVESFLTSCIFNAHRNSARIAFKKCCACPGVCARRSMPTRMAFGVMAESGALLAALSTCRYMPSHLARVDSERACHAAEPRKHSMSHPNVPAVVQFLVAGWLAESTA
jgi:hypothetical protein